MAVTLQLRDRASCLAPFLATRACVLAAALGATLCLGFDPPPVEQAAWRVSSGAIANLPARWDAYWYADIAEHGYRWDPGTPLQQSVVFFPAYPLALRAIHTLSGIPVLWGGVLLSLGAFAWATLVFRRIAAAEIGDAAASRAVWLLAAYPFAAFFSAAYTESLFLLALLGAWQASRERRVWLAAACGLLLGLTRPNGFLMSVPLACVWWTAALPAAPSEGAGWSRARLAGLAVAATPVIGMAAYCVFLWWQFDEPFAWIKGQAAWGSLTSGMRTPTDPRWGAALPWRWSDIPVHAGNTAAALFSVAVLVPLWRRLSPAHALVVGLNVLPPLAAHGILSMGRFSSVLFPLFLWLGVTIPAERHRRWVWWFLIGQAVVAALHYSWRLMT